MFAACCVYYPHFLIWSSIYLMMPLLILQRNHLRLRLSNGSSSQSNEAEIQRPCSFCYWVTLPLNSANSSWEWAIKLYYSYIHPFNLFVHLFIKKHLLNTLLLQGQTLFSGFSMGHQNDGVYAGQDSKDMNTNHFRGFLNTSKPNKTSNHLKRH